MPFKRVWSGNHSRGIPEVPMQRALQAHLLTVITLLLPSAALALDHCKPLEHLAIPDVTIDAITDADQPVAHCKVDGCIGRSIRFSVWLPTNWNGIFVMGGGRGFAGSLNNQAGGIDGSWALRDYEAIVNYGHLAVHGATVTSKAIVDDFYARAPGASYFFGCSNGGRQALIDAQRYPDDFDAIVAGAPALDF